MAYDIYDKLSFGKYKGEAICTVLANDPQYIDWCIKNVPNFKVSPAVEFQLKEKLEEKE